LRVAMHVAEQLDGCSQRELAWRKLEHEIERAQGTDTDANNALSRAMTVLARKLEDQGRVESARQWMEQRLSISKLSVFQRVLALVDVGNFYVRHRHRSLAYQRYLAAVELMRHEGTTHGASVFQIFSDYSDASIRASMLAIANRDEEKGVEIVDRFHSEYREYISYLRAKVSSSAPLEPLPSIEQLRADFLRSLVSRPNLLEREGDRDAGCTARYVAARVLRSWFQNRASSIIPNSVRKRGADVCPRTLVERHVSASGL